MSNSAPNTPVLQPRSAFYWILIFFIYMIMAGISTSFIIGQLLTYLFNGNTESSISFITQPEQYPGQEALYISIQALASMLLFIGGSWFFLKRENGPLLQKLTTSLNNITSPNLIKGLILVAILVPVSFLLEDINVYLLENTLPTNITETIEASQASTKALYEYLLTVPNISILILSIAGIAIIPAIGEELVFRGVLQNLFTRSLKNTTAAIWLSALLFSLFHGNWDGFLVRLLLGTLFGYMYYQSKNIYVPMIAHATNNSISLILGYLITNKITNLPFEYSFIQDGTWIYLLIYSVIALGSTFYFLSKKNKNGFRLG